MIIMLLVKASGTCIADLMKLSDRLKLEIQRGSMKGVK
jgi:hypothetical protein